MLKKLFVIVVMMILVTGMCGNVKAAELKTNLNVVQTESEAKQLENSQGKLQSKVVSCDSTTGTIKVELSVSNTKPTYENTEILIIVDENLANNPTKLNQYIDQVSSLANIVFKLNIKIGVIGMKGTISNRQVDSTGKLVIGQNDEGKVNGSASDAEVLVHATNDAQAITTALHNMNSGKITYNSNLQAALKLAKSTYSNNVNKILISTYEGVPSTAIGVCKEVTYGEGSQYTTIEQAVEAKNKDIVSKTKTEIQSLKNTDTDFMLLKLGNANFTQKWYSPTTKELELEVEASQYAQNLYGTTSNPTYGKIYDLENSGLTTTLMKMYQEFTKVRNTTITSVMAKTYFSKEIRENYTITIGDNAIAPDISKLETDGYITWSIDTLKTGETATLQYILKIKDMNNQSLFNKTALINQKVELTYQDGKGENYTATLSSSPSVQLVNKQEEQNKVDTEKDNKNGTATEEKKQDPTTAKGTIPQTGINRIVAISLVSAIIIVIAILYKKYHQYKDI